MARARVWYLGLAALLGAVMLLCGCGTRPISNSGYAAQRNGGENPFYRGELTEFDVLGIDFGNPTTDQDIAQQLANHRKVVLRKGAPIMIIQSGAQIPDDAMVRALERDFAVIPFSGVPVARRVAGASAAVPAVDTQAADYARALRLVAAKAGAEAVFCYWGVLESAKDREPTKAITWVPLVGSVIPDEAQHMRIRLEVAVIDVRTGSWSMFAPEAHTDSTMSASRNREASDQGQVMMLKERAYQSAAAKLLAKYVE
ncbi:MAG TPA: hypothetical protein VF502_02915 [Stellaceae bacterium]